MLLAWLAACTPHEAAPAPAPEAAQAVAPVAAVTATDPCVGRVMPVKDPIPKFEAEAAATDTLEHLLGYACVWETQDAAEAAHFAGVAASRPDAPAAAHFLLARALMRVRTGGRDICETEAYRSTILEHLVLAGKEPGYAEAAKDPLFNEFSTALRYRVATGHSIANLGALADGLVIYAPAAGVYGSQEKLTLAPGGLLQREVLAFTEADEPVRVTEDRPGGWAIDGDALQIDPGDGRVRVRVTPAFQLVTDTGELRWVDSDSECEA